MREAGDETGADGGGVRGKRKEERARRRSRGPPPFLRNTMTDVEDVGRGFTRGPGDDDALLHGAIASIKRVGLPPRTQRQTGA